MWILGNFRKEFLFLYLPALISVAVSLISPDLGGVSAFYYLLATGVIDSGHVYTTVWRTYFHSEERSSHHAYLWMPFFFFLLFGIWFYLGIPHLWAFVVYATLYHHVRQVYGFSKWYQKLNHRADKISDGFLYILSYLPMVIYHFRENAISNYYTEGDLFLYPSPAIHKVLMVLYVFVAVSWIVYEFTLKKKGIVEINRVISVGLPASIYAFCFLYGKTVTQVLFPLLFLHGIAYFAVMGQTLNRTQKKFTSAGFALLIVIGTAVVMGLGESWWEEAIVNFDKGDEPVLRSIVVGLWLTPLFCHYAFDAIIWRKGHRESAVVFAKH